MAGEVKNTSLDARYRMGHTHDVMLKGVRLNDKERREFRDTHRFHYDNPDYEKATAITNSHLDDIKTLYNNHHDLFKQLNVSLEAAISEHYRDEEKKKQNYATIEMRMAAFQASVADARKTLKAQYADEDSEVRNDYLKAFDAITTQKARRLEQTLTKVVKNLDEQNYYMQSLLRLVSPVQLQTAIDSGTFDPENPRLEDIKVIRIPTTVPNTSWPFGLGLLGVDKEHDYFGTSQFMYNHGLTFGWAGYGFGWAGATRDVCIYITRDSETDEISFDIPDVPDGTPDRSLKVITENFIKALKAEGVTDIHFGARNQRLLKFMAEASVANNLYMTFYLPGRTKEEKDEPIPIERIVNPDKLQSLARRIQIKQSANPTKMTQDPNECKAFVKKYREEVAKVMQEDDPEDHYAREYQSSI